MILPLPLLLDEPEPEAGAGSPPGLPPLPPFALFEFKLAIGIGTGKTPPPEVDPEARFVFDPFGRPRFRFSAEFKVEVCAGSVVLLVFEAGGGG